MIEDSLNDGDYVVVRGQRTCEYGQTVVALHKTEELTKATLKKFRPSGNFVYLYPANSDMKPLSIAKEEWNNEWEIQGIVLISFHAFELTSLENIFI
jgi:repressor LexA